MQKYYYVDLDTRRPSVVEYDIEHLKEDMKEEGCSRPLELTDYDRRVFRSEFDAIQFLLRYTRILEGLNNFDICKSRALPALLYKRRYLVLSLMRLKLQTVRSYRKNWRSGQLFNLHDQTYFLTVRLKKIEPHLGAFKYTFEIPR